MVIYLDGDKLVAPSSFPFTLDTEVYSVSGMDEPYDLEDPNREVLQPLTLRQHLINAGATQAPSSRDAVLDAWLTCAHSNHKAYVAF